MNNSIPIMDLHCDLLAYLHADPKRTLYDDASRCSLNLLEKGNVKLQTLAIFCDTSKNSTSSGLNQVKIFQNIKSKFLEKGISILPAIENASGFFEEDESLEMGFSRIKTSINTIGPILYLSLTWNGENRFGGGNLTQIGLKKDGENLIEFLAEKNIAIDLSHTSDRLANEILNFIEKKSLEIIPIASHSNFRDVTNVPRNLPKDLALEIIKRGGVIGLNFVRRFLGEDPVEGLIKHIQYAFEIGAEDQLCFGADFFYDLDTPSIKNQNFKELLPFFIPPFENSGCYQSLIELLKNFVSNNCLEKIANKNFESHIHSLYNLKVNS